jgi:hypothetical protein
MLIANVLPMNISGVACWPALQLRHLAHLVCAPLSSGALVARPNFSIACKLLHKVRTKLERDLHEDGCPVEIEFA